MSVSYPKRLEPSEQRFFAALKQCYAARGYDIAVQRKVLDSAGMKKGSGIADLFHRIGWMHVDFSLLDPNTGETKLAIELDGKSHNDKRQKQNDGLKDAYLNSAGIAVIRFKVQRNYAFRKMNPAILAGLLESQERQEGKIKNPTTKDIRQLVESKSKASGFRWDLFVGTLALTVAVASVFLFNDSSDAEQVARAKTDGLHSIAQRLNELSEN